VRFKGAQMIDYEIEAIFFKKTVPFRFQTIIAG
jgi:hypothetical protein